MDDMTSAISGAREAAAPKARAHNPGDYGAVAGGLSRVSVKRKLAAIQRLMRGESLDAVSRYLIMPVHRLTVWRDKVVVGGERARGARARRP